MRRTWIALLVAGVLACGAKKPDDGKEVGTYVNTEMGVPVGELWFVQHALRDLKATDVPAIAPRVRDDLVPRLQIALTGAQKAHPPASMTPSHQKFLAFLTEYRDICTRLAAGDATAHEQLMQVTVRYADFQSAWGKEIDSHGASFTNVPGPDELPKPGPGGTAVMPGSAQ